MLEVENIRKDYGPLKVLDIPRWDVGRGESVALLGANATGKTTLLEIIAGLIPASRGTVYFDGKPITGPVRDIGIVLQNPVMFSTSVEGNVAFGIQRNGLSRDEKTDRIHGALRMVGLENISGKNAHKLSEGQKQRVAIARTLAMNPKLLLLDEPSASVDRESIRHIADILINLNEKEGLTLIVATHDIDFAGRVAKRTDLLRNGKPIPYITGNLFTGTARRINGGTSVSLTPDISIIVGGDYQGDVDVAILPEQVVLSREPIASSMRNCLKGRIIRLSEEAGRIQVVIDAGISLTAVLTKQSMIEMGITIGDDIHASFKAHGVLVFPHERGEPA